MSERTVLSRNPVPNYVPKEDEITRLVHEDGDVDYVNPYGHRINVYTAELETLIPNWIDQLRSMVRMLDDDDYLSFGQNFDTLLHAFDQDVAEVMEAVRRDIGFIECHRVGVNTSNQREGRVVRVVGTEFKPAEKEGNKVIPLSKVGEARHGK